MESLKQVVATLRREIIAALDEDKALPTTVRLEPERVVLSLSFSVEEKQGEDGSVALAFGVLPSRANASSESEGRAAWSHPHTLTVEFKLAPASASQSAITSSDESGHEASMKSTSTGSPTSEQVTETLVCIFGVPGFDSSARATVFREALAGLSDDQARAIIDSLRGMPTPGITPAAARARQLISRLLESGPGGPTRGREVLVEIFHRHTVQTLIRWVREKWKTQEEWLDEPVGRPNAGRRPSSGTRASSP